MIQANKAIDRKHERESREALHGNQYVQRFTGDRQARRVTALAKRISLAPGANILDVGCGTGLLASLLAGQYNRYTGLDFSSVMVQEARRQADMQGLRGCRFILGDAAETMRREVAAYDAIFLLDISEHVPDHEWAEIVCASWGCLKTGGRAYLHTPNLDFVVERLKQHGWMQQFPEHIAVRDVRDNERFFQEAGYASTDFTYLPHYNVLRWLHPLARLPLVGKLMAARLWITATK